MNAQKQSLQAWRLVSETFRDLPQQVKVSSVASALLLLLSGGYYLYVFVGARPQTNNSKTVGSVQTNNGNSSNGSVLGESTGQEKKSTSNNLPAPSANASPTVPAKILDLSEWKLTLPIGKAHDPSEITQPQLADYVMAPYFQVNDAQTGVQLQAPVGGVTTSGSKFPRSELREMTANGQNEASWSTTSGASTMTLTESIDHLPEKRPELVAAQIHGPSAYVILIRLNGSDLFVEGSGGNNLGTLDSNYTLGTKFDLVIVAQGGRISVSYNGVQKVSFANNTTGDYFKAGCYTQSNPSYGDNPSSYGQTTIYRLSVSHS